MDMGASTIARLKNKSRETGKPFQLHLQLFCQEELLRKVALSKYADNLVLKGGLFIYTLTHYDSRATIDVDFLLRNIPNSIEAVRRIMEEILLIDTGNDFITFVARDYVKISPQRKYAGVSVQLIGCIKNTRTPFNIDFGVGDVIVPRAERMSIPTQLDNFTAPEISTYSLESTVAEKFDAMLQRLELTSRMKDYYDIYYIANTFCFDGRKLQEAIIETLQNRGTNWDRSSFNELMSYSENAAMLVKWRQFIKRTKLSDLSFTEVLAVMNKFLSNIWTTIVDEEEFFSTWNCESREWVNGYTRKRLVKK